MLGPKYKIINKKRFMTCIFIALLLPIILITMFMFVNAKSSNNILLTPVYVNDGDTLWALSVSANNTDLQIRDYIEKVIMLNKLNGGYIKPGQLLYFPIKNTF